MLRGRIWLCFRRGCPGLTAIDNQHSPNGATYRISDTAGPGIIDAATQLSLRRQNAFTCAGSRPKAGKLSVGDWAENLGISPERLKEVVAKAGPMVSDVKKHLGH